MAQVETWVFSVDEYHQMSEAGILSEDDRVELIEGKIIKMSLIGSHHAALGEATPDALASPGDGGAGAT